MAEVKIKSIYKPDLDGFISQCEINYCLIVKLFPSLLKQKCEKISSTDSAGIDSSSIGSSNTDSSGVGQSELTNNSDLGELASYRSIVGLRIIEAVRYTTTLEMKFDAPSRVVKQDLTLIVRLYHDAKLLEVMEGVSASQLSAIRAVQDKNHFPIKLVDEKRQLNAFLGESLKVCLDLHSDKKNNQHHQNKMDVSKK